MDCKTNSYHDILERMLCNPSAEPTALPLSLLEDVTNGFSDDLQIGHGGFAVVYKVHCLNWPIIIIVDS
jgi:hypothetical protein